MKKGIMILILLVSAIATTMMMVPQVKAGPFVVIHDHPTDPVVKPKGECVEVINAIDGDKEPQWSTPPEGFGNIWLRGTWGTPRGSTTVSFTKASTVIYVQYHSSDFNDHNSDIYVDGVLVARIETYMRGHWYVEIRGLSYIQHTVKVHASDTPPVGDNDVWYFGIPGHVIIHDHPTESVIKPKDECVEVINGADGTAGGDTIKHGSPNYNIWLYGGGDPGWVQVNSAIASNVIYIQYHGSDANDGYTYIYVDGVLASSDIYTQNMGSWYVEIRGLPMARHTVKVGAFGPGGHPDDNDVWYFGFGAPAVGGIATPIDKLGLLAPYIALTSTIVVATVATAIYARRVKRRKEK